VHVDLAAVRHDHVALESVDVDHPDGDLLAGGRASLEFAGVGSDETAPRDTVRTGHEELLDLLTAVRKPAVERLQVGAPLVQSDRRRTTYLDDDPWRHQLVERRCVLFVHRPVEALNQCSDLIVGRISHKANDIRLTRREVCNPVPRDVDAAGDPHLLVGLHVIEEALKCGDARRPAYQPAVQPN
jgi:hypothetical protein